MPGCTCACAQLHAVFQDGSVEAAQQDARPMEVSLLIADSRLWLCTNACTMHCIPLQFRCTDKCGAANCNATQHPQRHSKRTHLQMLWRRSSAPVCPHHTRACTNTETNKLAGRGKLTAAQTQGAARLHKRVVVADEVKAAVARGRAAAPLSLHVGQRQRRVQHAKLERVVGGRVGGERRRRVDLLAGGWSGKAWLLTPSV